MNEKLFHNDGAPTPMPLVSLFGATNELPEGKELEALFDRFLLRFDVQYLRRPTNFRAVVTAPEPVPSIKLPFQALVDAQAAARSVAVTDSTIDALIAIRDACNAGVLPAGVRRPRVGGGPAVGRRYGGAGTVQLRSGRRLWGPRGIGRGCFRRGSDKDGCRQASRAGPGDRRQAGGECGGGQRCGEGGR
jgi:hypothetical protein